MAEQRDEQARTRDARIEVGRVRHGVGKDDYLPGNVCHLVSPIVGDLRRRERDGEPLDLAWMIDRLSLVLDLAYAEDERHTRPAETKVASLIEHGDPDDDDYWVEAQTPPAEG